MVLTHQQAVIDGIRREYGVDPATGQVANTLLYQTLSSSLNLMAENLNSDVSHFLLELIQNADDLKYPCGVEPLLKFQLRGFDLLVVSNETGFTERDVRAICAAGLSPKAGNEDTTGEKGVGFKSLFKAVDEVTISSNGYYFHFSRANPCGLVIPVWKELPAEYHRPEYKDKTLFLLKFTNNDKRAKVRDDLQYFDSKLLLFLRRLRSIEVESDGKKGSVKRRDVSGDNGLTTTLETRGFGAPSVSTDFAVVPHTFDITVRDDDKRKGRKQSTVALAFPLGQIDNDCQAYNVLPICETGYPFLFQADFLLVGSREGLDYSHSAWNQMLFDALAVAFCRAVDRFHQSPTLRYRWLRYLPLSPGAPQFKKLSTLIRGALQKSNVILTQGGSAVVPSDTFLVPDQWKDHYGPLVEFSDLTPPNVSTHYQLAVRAQFEWLGCKEPTSKQMLNRFKEYLQRDDGASFNAQSFARHAVFARALSAYNISEIHELPIVPLQDGRRIAAKAKTIFYPRTGSDGILALGIPRGLPDVEILDPKYAAAAGQFYHTFYTRLGVKQGSIVDICRLIKSFHSSRLAPKCEASTIVEHLIYLFRAWMARSFVEKDLNVWLLNIDGLPMRASQMYQPAKSCRHGVQDYFRDTSIARSFMHSMYLSKVDGLDLDKFSEWLFTHINVFRTLRIAADNDLTTSMTHLLQLKELPSMKLLDLIAEAWPSNFSARSAPPSVIDALKSTLVACTNGTTARLDQTFLPSRELRRVVPDGMSMVDINDPEHHKWRVLDNLGVVTQITSQGSSFWLTILRAFMRQSNPKAEDISQVYQRLSQGGGDPAGEVRQFFQDHAAIFIPSNKRWLSSRDCIWNSEVQLKHKCMMSSEYSESFEMFFKHTLKVPNATIDHVVNEMSFWTAADDPDYTYAKSLVLGLKTMYETSSRRLGESMLRNALATFRKLRIVPVTTEDANGRLQRMTAAIDDAKLNWYFSDSSQLEAAFRNKVWTADFSQEESIKLANWLKSITKYIPRSRPRLTEAVMETWEHHGVIGECSGLTKLLRSRSSHLAALAKSNPTPPKDILTRLDNLAKARILSTAAITTRRTINVNSGSGGMIEGVSTTETDAMFQASTESLEVVVTSKGAGEGRQFSAGAIDCLGLFLGISDDKHCRVLDRVLSAQTDSHARDVLARREIFIEDENIEMTQSKKVANEEFRGPSTPAAGPNPPAKQEAKQPVHKQANNDDPPVQESATNGTASFQVPEPSRPTTSSTYSRSPAESTIAPPRTSTTNGHATMSGRAMTRTSLAQYFLSADSSSIDSDDQSASKPPLGPGLGPHRTKGAHRTAETTASASDLLAGAKGELEVYKFLQKHLPGSIKPEHWTSELRHIADPSLEEWEAPDAETFYADFTFHDTDSKLADYLYDNGFADDFPAQDCVFHVEVKSTRGDGGGAFQLSEWQWKTATEMSLANAEPRAEGREKDVFVLFRVNGVATSRPTIEITVDVFRACLRGELTVRLPGGVTLFP